MAADSMAAVIVNPVRRLKQRSERKNGGTTATLFADHRREPTRPAQTGRVSIEDSLAPCCYEAMRDNIGYWAHGIGDDNPLWCEPQHPAKIHAHTAAPPSFIFALNPSFSGYVCGLPGVHAMFAGIDAVWHRRMLLGDQFTTKARLKELVEHETRFAGRAGHRTHLPA